jgi:hypothetical protein
VSQTANPTSGVRVTFRELFKRHPIVEVPIIQRDYVQGRASELEVRTEFLNALHTALSKPKGDPSLPLDLDFVYGSVESTDRKAFCPLDGQQRLTTLFLLHWYLAWRDARGEDFVAFITSDENSRFTYAVRASSGEFFDALVGWRPETSPENILSLSDSITDEPWFFRSWILDPTIQSVLTMLDAIHARFTFSEGFYHRLVSNEDPCVTFQLLDLRNFGLSDDLYIKMNARGKPLTTFETFKARLEQHLDAVFTSETLELHGRQVSIRHYFSHRVDTIWADLFWRHRDRQTHLFDDRLMHLIRALAIVTRNPERAGVDLVLQPLRNNAISFSFLRYQESGCLDRNLLETLIAVLDGWCGGLGGIRTHLLDTAYFDERRIFEKVIKNSTELSYEELVQFHAYCAYVNIHRIDPARPSLGGWMRVISNLAVNTNYDRLDDFKRSIRSVNDLLNESDGILEYLARADVSIQGFNEQQIREEKLKAQLIRRSKAWELLILKAEEHGYFKGQIEFLFKFSGVLDHWIGSNSSDWDSQDDEIYRQAFANYFAKASIVFSFKGLNDFGEYRWERALLSMGNYLLSKGNNYSFLNDSDRDASWKRLLRGALRADDSVEMKRRYVKDLLDQIDLNIGPAESLTSVIAQTHPIDEWRQAIVSNYEVVEYCRNRMIRWLSPDRVYLLRKSRMNGEHAELFTYQLQSGPLSQKLETGDLAPFDVLRYQPVNTDADEPSVRLEYSSDDVMVVLSIFTRDGGFLLKLFNQFGQLPALLTEDLTGNPIFKEEMNGMMSRTVGREEIEEAIEEVVRIVRNFSALRSF